LFDQLKKFFKSHFMTDPDYLSRLYRNFDKEASRLEVLELLFLVAFLTQPETCGSCEESVSFFYDTFESCMYLPLALKFSLRILLRSAAKFSCRDPGGRPEASPFVTTRHRERVSSGLKRKRQIDAAEELVNAMDEVNTLKIRNVRGMKAELQRQLAEADEASRDIWTDPSTDSSVDVEYLTKLVARQRKMLSKYFEYKSQDLYNVQRYQDSVDTQHDQIVLLQEEVANLTEVKADRDRLNCRLMELETLKKEKAELVKDLELSQLHINELNVKIGSINASHIKAVTQDHFRTNIETVSLKDRIIELEVENSSLRTELTQRETDAKNIETLSAEVASLKNSLYCKVISDSCMSVPSTPREGSLRVAELEEAIDLLQQRNAQLVATIAAPESREDYSRDLEIANERLRSYVDLQDRHSGLLIENTRLAEAHSKLQVTYQELNDSVLAKDLKISELNRRLTELSPENQALNKKCEELNEQVKQLKTLYDSQRMNYEEKLNRVSGLELREGWDIREKNKTLKLEVERLMKEVERLMRTAQ
jgi:hypothetical protein